MNKQKVVIVGGGGMVGASAAYACAVRNVVEEIVLIDRSPELAWGQAADINDAMGIDRNVVVRAGDYDDIQTDDIVVITAGVPQQPGQTRLELIDVNAGIMRDIARNVRKNGQEPYIMVVANPVDVLTHVALVESGMPSTRVFGTGTVLDTARLKSYIADKLKVSSKVVDAYILGEHGDSSFSNIETASIGSIPIGEYPGFEAGMFDGVEQIIRDRAYKVIEAKKSTYFAIGFVISKLASALKQSSTSIYPVCSLTQGEYGLDGVVMGLPSSVSRDGVKILSGLQLNERQMEALHASAHTIRESIHHAEQG